MPADDTIIEINQHRSDNAIGSVRRPRAYCLGHGAGYEKWKDNEEHGDVHEIAARPGKEMSVADEPASIVVILSQFSRQSYIGRFKM